MSIKAHGIRIEASTRDHHVWMDSIEFPGMAGYVNGVQFNPDWGVFAVVRDLERKCCYFLQFPTRAFLDDVYGMTERYKVLAVFESAPQGAKPEAKRA